MYTYEKYTFRPLPTLLLISGIIFVATGMYIEGGICGTLGSIFFFSFRGFNIDPMTRRLRKFDRFLWFYLGAWQPYPKPLYITVVSIKIGVNRSSPSPIVAPGSGKSIRTYKLNLVVEGKERYIPLMRGKRELLLKEGLTIARLLHIKLLDHTTSEKRWIS